jgi:hypothetical protein
MSEAQPPIPPPPSGPAPYKYRSGSGCCCTRCRCSSLTWPVLLITLGVLFLLPQFIHDLHFGHLWPVLLIVIGVLKLLESTASAEGHRG